MTFYLLDDESVSQTNNCHGICAVRQSHLIVFLRLNIPNLSVYRMMYNKIKVQFETSWSSLSLSDLCIVFCLYVRRNH